MTTLRIGHSPDPDDAFMFCALSKGAVRIRDFQIEHALDGYGHIAARLWTKDGQLLALSRQTTTVFD